MHKLYIDIETYSATDLKAAGVYRYAEDPSFEILMAAYALDDDPVRCAIGERQIEDVPFLWDPNVLKIAHNANFERVCFTAHTGFLDGPDAFLPPEEWHDTAAVAAEKGYPRKLEHLTKFLGTEQKDTAGTRLINLFCKPNKKGERNRPEDYPEEWLQFIDYCIQDVIALRDVDRKLGDWPTETERQIYLSDQWINDTGMSVDVELCTKAAAAVSVSDMEGELEINLLTGGAISNPNSLPQVTGWLRETGLRVPNLRAETVEGLLQGSLDDLQRRVLVLRQELALAAPKKFAAALSQVSDDNRLRGRFQFFGAHTGRWSGRGAQPQNLPRASFETTLETEEAILDLLLDCTVDRETLKKLVRAMFLGPLTVVDYASIEARVIAWLANERWALDAFRKDRDIYVETAERMSTPGNKLTRAQGKVAVLALGYNGGINSLRNMGGEGTDEELQKLVYSWRDANPKIKNLWQQLGEAFRRGGEAGPRLHVERDGTSRYLVLPSGRAIYYHRCKFEREDGLYGPRWAMSFADPERPGTRTRTYGGKLTENATQAVARDILGEALVRLHERGHTIVGHVHDEVLVEGAHSVENIAKIMCESPVWADGLPISGEGFTANRYRKG